MRGFYCELWVKSHTYYAEARGDNLKKLAKAIGGRRPEDDTLNKHTWKSDKPWVKPAPKRWW
jgi:hypothetical protein